MGADEFLRKIHDAQNGVKERGMFEGRGPLAILLLVFIGGLALNLTPCVLPMIPINLAIIGAGTQAGSRGRGFLLGGVYGLAMAVVYGVLGVIVILTAGTFGTINSSPWFNLGIAVLPAPASRQSSFRSSCSRATCTPRAQPSRSRCPSSSVSAWPRRGLLPERDWPRCRSRGRGWCASSRFLAS